MHKQNHVKLSSLVHCNENCSFLLLFPITLFCLASFVCLWMARQQYLISKFLYDGKLSQVDDSEVSGESVPASVDSDGYAKATSTPIDCPSVDAGTQVQCSRLCLRR